MCPLMANELMAHCGAGAVDTSPLASHIRWIVLCSPCPPALQRRQRGQSLCGGTSGHNFDISEKSVFGRTHENIPVWKDILYLDIKAIVVHQSTSKGEPV